MKFRPYLLLFLLAGIFLVVGIVMLLRGISSSMMAMRSSAWPTVPGIVTASWVDSYISISTATSNESETTSSTLYNGQISYSYTVNGQKFTGSQISFGDYSSTDSNHAEEVTSRYPLERAVTVFYDPQNPAQAVLEPGFGGMLLIPLGIGGVFTLAGGGMLAGLVIAIRRGIF